MCTKLVGMCGHDADDTAWARHGTAWAGAIRVCTGAGGLAWLGCRRVGHAWHDLVRLGAHVGMRWREHGLAWARQEENGSKREKMENGFGPRRNCQENSN